MGCTLQNIPARDYCISAPRSKVGIQVKFRRQPFGIHYGIRSRSLAPGVARLHAPRCTAETTVPSSCVRLSTVQPAAAWESYHVQGFGYKEIVTRPCRLPDAFPVADVHVTAFYPSSGLFKPVLRLDRILALIIGEKLDQKSDEGRCFICFVADARPHKLSEDAPFWDADDARLQAHDQRGQLLWSRAVVLGLLKLLGGEGALDFWGVSHSERGMLGAVVFDTFGFHVPGRWSAEKGWERRRNIGYISNLAVAPGARRQGIARRLVKRCEEVAMADEEVEAVALHVDGGNGAGQKLYETCGYELVTRTSEWKALLGINENGTGLDLMIKRLRPAAEVAESSPQDAAPS